MPQVIRVQNAKIDSNENQIVITLEPIVIEVNVNVNQETKILQKEEIKQQVENELENNWVLPSFGNKKIKFGKEDKVKGE